MFVCDLFGVCVVQELLCDVVWRCLRVCVIECFVCMCLRASCLVDFVMLSGMYFVLLLRLCGDVWLGGLCALALWLGVCCVVCVVQLCLCVSFVFCVIWFVVFVDADCVYVCAFCGLMYVCCV